MFKKSILFSGALFFVGLGCKDYPKKPKKVEKKIEKKVEVKKVEIDPLKEAKENANSVALPDLKKSVATADMDAVKIPHLDLPFNRWVIVEKDKGSLAANEINKIFHNHKSAMRKCYNRQLKTIPDIRGKLSLHVRITASGRVSSASVSGISGKVAESTELHECMVSQAKTMTFPKRSISVSKPYYFAPLSPRRESHPTIDY